jgi:hypothetical protein
MRAVFETRGGAHFIFRLFDRVRPAPNKTLKGHRAEKYFLKIKIMLRQAKRKSLCSQRTSSGRWVLVSTSP